MASMTIRNIDDELKSILRTQAAHHGHSMEEEVRRILRESLGRSQRPVLLGQRLSARFSGMAAEISLPVRTWPRRPLFGDEAA